MDAPTWGLVASQSTNHHHHVALAPVANAPEPLPGEISPPMPEVPINVRHRRGNTSLKRLRSDGFALWPPSCGVPDNVQTGRSAALRRRNRNPIGRCWLLLAINACSAGEASTGGGSDIGAETMSTDATRTASTGGSTPGPSTAGATTLAPMDLGSGMHDLPAGERDPCRCHDQWSYLWTVNGLSSISKINTRTLQEEGRYLSRADNQGSPSRISVSVDGRAAVVANRNGGLTKIWARPELCTDKNHDGEITTAQGSDDPLAFDEEECIAWTIDFPDVSVQRPAAWTSGTHNADTCEWEDQKIWTTTGHGSLLPLTCQGHIEVLRVDGATGMVEDAIALPEDEVPCTGDGPYDGVADANGDFWFQLKVQRKLVRIDHDTLDFRVYEDAPGGYSIGVDTRGRVFTNTGHRFDPGSGTWQLAAGSVLLGASQGAEDNDGLLWTNATWLDDSSGSYGVAARDPVSLTVIKELELGRGFFAQPIGLGVDIDGYLWSVSNTLGTAFRIDPRSLERDKYFGLAPGGLYSLTDLTGGQIQRLACH